MIIGVVLIGIVVFGVLSMRPGGIRNQFRNMARRLKLAFVLGGIFMLVSGVCRIAIPNTAVGEWGPIGVAVVLSVIFLVMSVERPVESSQTTARAPSRR